MLYARVHDRHSRAVFTVLLAAALVVGTATSAAAQIYVWRDANGHLVLSDRKLDPDAASYAVPQSEVRTTRPPVAQSAQERVEPLVREYASRRALRPELVRAVIQVESAFSPTARSPKGAMGLMQLMPATAASLGVGNPFDPEENIRGGTAYLRQLLDRYGGSEELALAAYNAGPGAVDRYGRQIPPYRETRDYVRRVGAASPPVSSAPARPGSVVYKTIEIVDGRPVARYSTERPASAVYEIVAR